MRGDLGDTLRVLRRSREETLNDVADATGLSVAMLSRIERGQRFPSPETLSLLASHFGLPQEELLGEVIAERMCDRYGVEPASWAAVTLVRLGPFPTAAVAREGAQSVDAHARDCADIACTATVLLDSAVRELARWLGWGSRAQAISACAALMSLSEIPRHALREASEHHPDPAVRQAAADMLSRADGS